MRLTNFALAALAAATGSAIAAESQVTTSIANTSILAQFEMDANFPNPDLSASDAAGSSLTGTLDLEFAPVANPTSLQITGGQLTQTAPIQLQLIDSGDGVIATIAPGTVLNVNPTSTAVAPNGAFSVALSLTSTANITFVGVGGVTVQQPSIPLPPVTLIVNGTLATAGGTATVNFTGQVNSAPINVNAQPEDFTLQLLRSFDVTANGPITERGGCCLPNGTCSNNVTEPDCLAQLGTFLGDNVACAPQLCPDPIGVCCLPDGSCINTQENGCLAVGGAFSSQTDDCSSVICLVVETPPACPCELNGAGPVNIDDLLAFLACWFPASNGAPCP